MWVPDTYEDILAQAHLHSMQGDFEGSIALYNRLAERLSKLKPELLKRRPELRDIHHNSLVELAWLHHALGNFEQSLALYRQLSELEVSDKTVWHQKAACVLIDMGRVEQGLDELRAEAMAHPGAYETWLLMGRECAYLERWQEAEENLNRALRNATTPESRREVYQSLFELYRAQGRVEDALAAWNHAYEGQSEPDEFFPVYQMLIEHGELERARPYLEREPNALRRGFYQGLLEALTGRKQEAQRRWQKVATMNPLAFEDGVDEWAEAVLRTNSNPQEVVKVLDRFKGFLDEAPRRLVLLAIAQARLGNMEEAEQSLKQGCVARKVSRPRREKLSAKEWALFDELVTDAEVKDRFKHLFETDQNEQHTS
ncbi:MAG: hypothetical protein ACP5R2_04555 [Anaerolineae bacterium]